MIHLNSEYQYVGRSSAIPTVGGKLSYYLLLYAKATTDETRKYVSVKEVLACTEVKTFGEYKSYFHGYVDSAIAFYKSDDDPDKPSADWELGEFSEGGVTYRRGTVIGSGTVFAGRGATATVSCLWQMLEAASDPYVPVQGTYEMSALVYLPALTSSASIAVSDADIGSATIIVLQNQRAGNIYELYYTDLEGNGRTNITYNASQPTYGWTLPMSLYNKLPYDSKAMKIVVQCVSYNASAVWLDSYYTEITVRAKESDCIPDLSFEATVDDLTLALTKSHSRVVNGITDLSLSLSFSAKHGASVASVTVRADGKYDGITGSVLVSGIQSDYVPITVVDTRGFSVQKAISLSLVPYIPITSLVTIERVSPTSDQIYLSVRGNVYNGAFDVGGTEENSVGVSVLYRKVGETEWSGNVSMDEAILYDNNTYYAKSTTYPLSGFSYNEKYEFLVSVVDRVSSRTNTVPLKKGVPLFDWGEEDFRFNIPMHHPDEPLIVTGTFPIGWQSMPQGAIAVVNYFLSHTWDEIGEAFNAGREVRFRFTNNDLSYEFGGWNLRYAELTLSQFEANAPAAGYYNIYASGMGYATGTNGTVEATPMQIYANMSNFAYLATTKKA